MIKNIARISLIAALTLSAGGAQSEVQTFGNKVRLVKTSTVKLTKKQKIGLSDFRRNKAYFGAFYINTAEDTGYWVRNFHVLENAKKAAKTGCRYYSKISKDTCVLYALILPRDMDPATKNAAGLSQGSLKFFEGKYRKKQARAKQPYGAFAINGANNSGAAWGKETAAEARSTALAWCEAGAARLKAQLNIFGRKWAEKSGMDRCRIVDENDNR